MMNRRRKTEPESDKAQAARERVRLVRSKNKASLTLAAVKQAICRVAKLEAPRWAHQTSIGKSDTGTRKQKH